MPQSYKGLRHPLCACILTQALALVNNFGALRCCPYRPVFTSRARGNLIGVRYHTLDLVQQLFLREISMG